MLIPAAGNEADAHSLIERLDGILLTGSRTNIAPLHYGGQAAAKDALQDPARDATTLPLIRAAIARGIPVLAICRGMQEMNVALGGTLFQHLPALPGRLNHAAAEPEDSVGRVAPAHSVTLTRGGLLHRLAQGGSIEVNSLHHQGIDRLGSGLIIEAVAPDGTIEAVRAVHCAGFAVGVQWHPEFDAACNPISRGLFRAFRPGDVAPGTLRTASRPIEGSAVNFAFEVVRHTPIFVWLIAVFVCLRSLRSLRTRWVSLVSLFIVPVIFIAGGVTGASLHAADNLIGWAILAFVCVPTGYFTAPQPLAIDHAKRRLKLPRALFTALRVPAIFIIRYALAVLSAVQPGTQGRNRPRDQPLFGGRRGLLSRLEPGPATALLPRAARSRGVGSRGLNVATVFLVCSFASLQQLPPTVSSQRRTA